MIYFDTDVLVHYLINQDEKKQSQARKVYHTATNNEECFISMLTLQELTFVLAKLKIADSESIRSILEDLLLQASVSNIDSQIFLRAMDFAGHIGHRSFNDCLHLALAERHFKSLVTFNKEDFKKLQKHTHLKINIL